MRLAGIRDIDVANGSLEQHNARFAKALQETVEPIAPCCPMPLRWSGSSRPPAIHKLSQRLTCQLQGRDYQVTGHDNGYRLRGTSFAPPRTPLDWRSWVGVGSFPERGSLAASTG